MANGLSPVISTVVSLTCLGEGLSKYKMFVLVRNAGLTLMIVNPFGTDATDFSKLIAGVAWVSVAALGTGTMRVVQRSNDAVPGTVLTFWGFAINSMLWFPPGCVPPELRVEVLWPPVPQDQHDINNTPVITWIIMCFSGILGAALMVVQGWALQHLDVGTYSMTVTPLGLVFSTLYGALQKPLAHVVILGVVLQVLALLLDMYLEKRSQK